MDSQEDQYVIINLKIIYDFVKHNFKNLKMENLAGCADLQVMNTQTDIVTY